MTAAPVLEPSVDNHGVQFGLVELDLLATNAGGRFPFPLRVPEFGRIPREREVLLAAAGATLMARGLASERGPLGIAAEVVTALRERRGTVDLVLVDQDEAVGVVAVVYRSWALIFRQVLTGDPAANGLWIRRVAQNALADELFELVPDVDAATTMPITVPPEHVGPAEDYVLDDLGRLLPELTGTGQLGGSHHAARADDELSWVDGPRGRLRVHRADDGWTSVNPLRDNELRYALNNLSMIARREHHGT